MAKKSVRDTQREGTPRQRSSAPAASSGAPIRANAKPLPIVGIGASAGGLEALEQFFRHVPPKSGIAFVVIQHLDPTRKGLLPELLGRMTPMPVSQAREGVRLMPNRVYVIPPNKDLSVLQGRLHLLDPVAARGARMPIDFFLRALALERRELSVGVLLSGMGADGVLGLRAIAERGGLVLVQDPRTAKFESMPRSVIEAGLADVVLPADALPERIIKHLKDRLVEERDGVGADYARPAHTSRDSLANIVILLRDRNGHDFSLYKKSTMQRRIARRMAIHRIATISKYVHHLRTNPQELDLLFKELLIGVTEFFRDPAAWEDLRKLVLQPLLAEAASRPVKDKTLRAWVVGCSTGEDAYTLAISFREAFDQLKPGSRIRLQIFATDLDTDAIDRARQGLYPADIATNVPPARLERFFVREDKDYRICKEIREMVIFAPQDVTMDAPFTRLDILVCRNLLIYFATELQRKLLPLFHYSLNPGGTLFLGSAETVGVNDDLFIPMASKWRLYRARDVALRGAEVEFPSRRRSVPALSTDAPQADPAANLQTVMDRLLLQQYVPPAVLVSTQGDILYTSGRTGNYLEPAAGKANWNIHVMARAGLREVLASALPRAVRSAEQVTIRGVVVGTDIVDVTLQALDTPPALHGTVIIVFAKAPARPPAKAAKRSVRGAAESTSRLAELDLELRQARANLLTLAEEMQASKEELNSANEELRSTNEELQSTNEELTTSKEEMQSLNEELQSVNAELQAKVDDLSVANSDLTNLLNSTDIAIIFLDNGLRVRRFTTHATRIFKLIAGDAGRALSDIVTDLNYPALFDDAQDVLRTLRFCEKQVATHDGRWFTVRVMPYRTLDNVIDGVVLTFSDICAAKRLEAELRRAGRSQPDTPPGTE